MNRSDVPTEVANAFAEYSSRAAIPVPLGQRLPVTYQAAQQLQQMILDGVWAEGMRLPAQRELSEKLGVSRASLREALSVLETLGILSIEPGRGVFVRAADEPAPEAENGLMRAGRYSALDVFQVRYAINSTAATLAATRLTDTELHELQQITDAMRDALARRDFLFVSEQDFLFHSTLFKCCGNTMLFDLANTVQQERYESTALASADHSGLTLAVEEHQAVVDALVLRDPVKARTAIELHVRNAGVRAGIDPDLLLI